MFIHFNLIGLATWRLSWVVLSTNYLRRCHCRWWTLVVQTTEQWPRCKTFPPDFYWDKRWQNNKRVYKEFFVNVLNVYHIYDCDSMVKNIHVQLTWLLSSASRVVSFPRLNLSFGSRAYRIAAPKIWNCLPPHVLQSQTVSAFRRHLKTHYFQSAYPAP